MPLSPFDADALVAVLRGEPRSLDSLDSSDGPLGSASLRQLFDTAERHGLAGVLHRRLVDAGAPIPVDVARAAERRALAQSLDHEAHLALLRRVDRVLEEAGISAIVLKGPLFAERYYVEPSARGTSDIDLLVREAELPEVARALETLGYLGEDSDEERRFRREHFHLHFSHPAALPLELHFHAYRGFGRVLRSEPLIARKAASPDTSMRAIGVLSPEDELVYLAVHAAAHRFGRLSWLYDLRMLVSTMSKGELEVAADRARALGFARPLSFAAALLVEHLGLSAEALAPLGVLGPIRGTLARRWVSEPPGPVARPVTRFLYTTTLCDGPDSALRYTWETSLSRARSIVRSVR